MLDEEQPTSPAGVHTAPPRPAPCTRSRFLSAKHTMPGPNQRGLWVLGGSAGARLLMAALQGERPGT